MEFGNLIKFLKKQPSKKEQLAAVQQSGYNIRYIHNPDKEIQLAAVQNDGYSIRFIHNPDKEVQLAAVQQYGSSIQYINNLTPELLVAYLNSKECPQELKEYLSDPKFDPQKLFLIKGR